MVNTYKFNLFSTLFFFWTFVFKDNETENVVFNLKHKVLWKYSEEIVTVKKMFLQGSDTTGKGFLKTIP